MNAYFQLIAEGNVTAVRLVPATDGGDKLNINEMMDYLRRSWCLSVPRCVCHSRK